MMRDTLLLLLALPLGAQQQLTLRDAITQAVSGHPALLAGAARIDAAQGLRLQASLSPNPRLYIQTENLGPGSNNTPLSFNRDIEQFVYGSRVFETAGKRARRMDVASAGIRTSELEREALALQIATRVAGAYWNAAGAERVRNLLERSLETYERIVQYHQDRVREGAAAEADLIRVQLEHDRVSLAAANAAVEASRARLTLFREMGMPADSGALLTEALEVLPAFEPSDTAVAVANRPEVRLGRQAVEEARARVRLQRSSAVPDPEILFGYKRTAGLNTVLGGVQIALPFGNRNQGQIAAAEAELRAAQAATVAAENSARADIEIAAREWRALQAQISGPFRSLRERAEETARIAQAAYREGGADLLRLLDAERTRLEVEILYSQSLAAFQRSVVNLRAALGMMP
ncbi:MAG TPA: TolC family protein [Bryobacteraceae bacterium]|nr:TolC family protein [Bryobacteraceae bacterium]